MATSHIRDQPARSARAQSACDHHLLPCHMGVQPVIGELGRWRPAVVCLAIVEQGRHRTERGVRWRYTHDSHGHRTSLADSWLGCCTAD